MQVVTFAIVLAADGSPRIVRDFAQIHRVRPKHGCQFVLRQLEHSSEPAMKYASIKAYRECCSDIVISFGSFPFQLDVFLSRFSSVGLFALLLRSLCLRSGRGLDFSFTASTLFKLLPLLVLTITRQHRQIDERQLKGFL